MRHDRRSQEDCAKAARLPSCNIRATELLATWFLLALASRLPPVLLPGFELRGAEGALLVAAVFWLLNWSLGWLLSLFLGIATLALGFLLAFLTRWLVHAILLKLTDALMKDLTIRSFKVALVGALLMSFFGSVGVWLVRQLL